MDDKEALPGSKKVTVGQRPGTPPRTAYTVSEVAASLGVSKRHIYRLIESGEIPAKPLGRRLLIPAAVFRDLTRLSPID